MSRAEICHCSHDRATHFEKKYTCLGACCDCKEYAHRDGPKPVKPVPLQPKKDVDDDWGLPAPITHRIGCMCPQCFFKRVFP